MYYFEYINDMKKMTLKEEVKEKNFMKYLYNPQFERKIDEKFFKSKRG